VIRLRNAECGLRNDCRGRVRATCLLILLSALAVSAVRASDAVAPSQSELPWVIVACKELGLPTVIIGAFMYIVNKHLVPAWRERSERQDAAIKESNDRLFRLIEALREDHNRNWEQWRVSMGGVSTGMEKLCAIIAAHDERTTGGRANHVMARADQIQRERFGSQERSAQRDRFEPQDELGAPEWQR
jgi:hypothetical protein